MYIDRRNERRGQLQSALMASHLRFPCPHCNHAMKAPADSAGKRGRCPQCQQPVIIPHGEEHAVEPDLVDFFPAKRKPRGLHFTSLTSQIFGLVAGIAGVMMIWLPTVAAVLFLTAAVFLCTGAIVYAIDLLRRDVQDLDRR